jgi:hypothetical protein
MYKIWYYFDIVCFALSFKTSFVFVDYVSSSILSSYLGYLVVV